MIFKSCYNMSKHKISLMFKIKHISWIDGCYDIWDFKIMLRIKSKFIPVISSHLIALYLCVREQPDGSVTLLRLSFIHVHCVNKGVVYFRKCYFCFLCVVLCLYVMPFSLEISLNLLSLFLEGKQINTIPIKGYEPASCSGSASLSK